MVAGYCWDWKGEKDPDIEDVGIPGHGFSMRWNLDTDGSLWIIAPDSISEIGCIHTCQGLELDYVGVIIAPDLVVQLSGGGGGVTNYSHLAQGSVSKLAKLKVGFCSGQSGGEGAEAHQVMLSLFA